MTTLAVEVAARPLNLLLKRTPTARTTDVSDVCALDRSESSARCAVSE